MYVSVCVEALPINAHAIYIISSKCISHKRPLHAGFFFFATQLQKYWKRKRFGCAHLKSVPSARVGVPAAPEAAQTG